MTHYSELAGEPEHDDSVDTGTSHITDRGPSVGVYSGKPFYPLAPRADEIDIEDIAESLSKQCRFNGHTKEFYSVAQHCVLVAELLLASDSSPEILLWGLLHDAAEAYTGDCVRPVKKTLRDNLGVNWGERFEEPVLKAVAERYQLPYPVPKEVGVADAILLATEKRDLLNPQTFSWGPLPDPMDEDIEPWPWRVARHRFLVAFDAYRWQQGRSDLRRRVE